MFTTTLPTTRERTGVERLASRVSGRVITSDDVDLEAVARIWNGAYQRVPRVVVQASSTADVAEAVRFARAEALPLAVRSGGHGFAGHGSIEGGLVIDVSTMRGIDIDPAERTAWIEPGVTSRELAPIAHAHGLALSTGDVGSVGISGLVLGGGIGWMARSWGLTIDSLEEVELVTADGRVLLVAADRHPDLFWALRGGGGNFGVVTGMRFRLHAVPASVLGGMVGFRATPEVVREYIQLATLAPEALTTQALFFAGAPAADGSSTSTMAVLACWSGPAEDGRPLLARLANLGDPLFNLLGEMPYPAMYDFTTAGDIYGPGRLVRSAFIDEVDGALIEGVVAGTRTPGVMAQLRVLGGAMARVPVDATAFAHRQRPHMLALEANTSEGGQAAIVALEGMWDALRPRARGAYINFLADDGADRLTEAYPPSTLKRLAEVKRRYDPENLFRSNHNIAPAPRS